MASFKNRVFNNQVTIMIDVVPPIGQFMYPVHNKVQKKQQKTIAFVCGIVLVVVVSFFVFFSLDFVV